MGCQFQGIPGVEAEKVDHFTSGIDLGLVGIFAHIQHGGGINSIPPGSRKQICCFKKNFCTLFQGSFGPRSPGFLGGVDGQLDFFFTRLVKCGQYMAMIVG